MNVEMPSFTRGLFQPTRYKALKGGRGSGKSWGVARSLIIKASEQKLKILCGREFQNSIKESVHHLLSSQIQSLGFNNFHITRDEIRASNGSQFMFKGIRHNPNSIKSIEGIDIAWIEEAQTISDFSLQTLIPTVRKPNSELWFTFNPESPDDPISKQFLDEECNFNGRPNTYLETVNWYDNPWFPDVLREEKDYLYSTDPDLADHVWGGNFRTNSDAQVMNGKWVYMDCPIDAENWYGPFYGADFGFSNDPSTLIEMYIDPVELELHITGERWGLRVDIDHLPAFYAELPNSKNHVIWGDCSRPETINYVNRNGYVMKPCTKWSGSVEDGIAFLRSFKKIVVHHGCEKTRDEMRHYRYKVDKLTGEVTRIIEDKHNHCIDGIRYGLDPLITKGATSILDVL